MIVVMADCSESLHGSQTRCFKSACKTPGPGASRNRSNSKLKVEWRSAPEKNLRAEAQEEKLSEPVTLAG
jgi:hypothetical protein